MAVTDGRGHAVAAGGLGPWLTRVAPLRASGEVAIALVSDSRIQHLNKVYRRKNTPTDVLSFPAFALRASAGEPAEIALRASAGRPAEREARRAESGERTADRALGDIAIATGVARRQAKAAGHSYETELRVLALHGLLHLLGYDHDGPDDQGRMARAEARLRKKGGLAASLIEQSGQRRNQRLRPERAAGQPPPRLRRPAEAVAKAGGQRRAAAPASESAWGWGPARSKK